MAFDNPPLRIAEGPGMREDVDREAKHASILDKGGEDDFFGPARWLRFLSGQSCQHLSHDQTMGGDNLTRLLTRRFQDPQGCTPACLGQDRLRQGPEGLGAWRRGAR
jgi:hypothetical protein